METPKFTFLVLLAVVCFIPLAYAGTQGTKNSDVAKYESSLDQMLRNFAVAENAGLKVHRSGVSVAILTGWKVT